MSNAPEAARWAGLPPGPQVMGIVNATPDSFSDGGRSLPDLISISERMLADGAAIIDVGGESTRPAAEPVSPEEEQRRILPLVTHLARLGALVSVDTRWADTMRRVLDAGAAIINDVSGLHADPASAKVVAERGCPVILMHMRGASDTMDDLAQYTDVAAEVSAELQATVARAERHGIDRRQIAIDPGFGFAKMGGQNVDLLRSLSLFLNFSRPIVVGVSRKRFVGALIGDVPPAERDPASIAAGLFAIGQGASVLRVHDVKSTVQAVRAWTALTGTAGRG